MRSLAVFLWIALSALAQTPPQILTGKVASVAGDQVIVQSGQSASTVFYADVFSTVWRGKITHDFSMLRPGDEVTLTYRRDAGGRLVVVTLDANIAHITGRIREVSSGSFEVDQNYDADPSSAYRRQNRRVAFNAETKFDLSTPEDLKPGRDVDIVGLKLDGSRVQATRITVYEGKSPVRRKGSTPVRLPNGALENRN